MARADRRRVTRSKSAPAARSRNGRGRPSDHSRAVIEDTMFFPKLRRHAKWMFVFLALIFGVGFVVFNVGGSGSGGGLSDIFRNSGGATSDAPSVEDARARVAANPNNADAQRDLASALTAEGETDEAITALTRYTELRTRDENALRELAGLYLQKANRLQQEAEAVQIRANYLTAGSTFTDPLQLPGGTPLQTDPIVEAITTKANAEVNQAYTSAQLEFRSAADAYERVATIAPKDSSVRLELAQTAQRANDLPRAIAAYEEFVRLAPDDPSTPIVKQQIKQLKALNQTTVQPSG